jgi:putative thioredoxin
MASLIDPTGRPLKFGKDTTPVGNAPAGAAPLPPATAANIKDATLASFAADVLDASMEVPVIVDFWAPWCGPCKMVAPEIRKVAAELSGQSLVLKVNTEESPSLARKFRINAIPTMVLFRSGLEVARQPGAMPAQAIRNFIEQAELAPK